MEKPKLLDQMREKIRIRHYSIRTEKACWVRRMRWREANLDLRG